MSDDDTHSSDSESIADHTLSRRGALAGLGAGFGSLLSGPASAQQGSGSGGDQPWYDWTADVDAGEHAVRNLGAVSMSADDTSVSELTGANLSVTDGTLNADDSIPGSIHVVTDYPGETLDQKVENVLAALPDGDNIPNQQPGHRIVIPAPDPEDPAAADELPAWRVESPIVIGNNTGKLVFDMGWTLIYATETVESFFVIGPDEKTENITLNGGMFYAKQNLERSFVDIQGVGHMHVSRMYLQNLEGRNTVPAGIRLADYHGSSELTVHDTEVTGCRDAFLAEHGSEDVPYGPAFDLDIYNWRGGGGEHSIRIDGGATINLDSIQCGGHPLQSVSESIIKLENSVTATRKVSISNVMERHNAMEYHSGVAVADVTNGSGDRHDGVYIQNVDCYNAEVGTDLEYVHHFDQQNVRPNPVVSDDAAGSTRWFDDGTERRETDDSHAFHAGAGDGPSFVVEEDDVRMPGAGNGAILTTPDGSSQYRVRVDNGGNLVTEQVSAGGSERSGIVESFEDGDLSEWDGATDAYVVNGDPPVGDGDRSLKNTSGDTAIITSTDGLPRYPQAGDTFAAAAARTETNSTLGVAFGVQDARNLYFVRVYPEGSGDRLQLYKRVNGEYTGVGRVGPLGRDGRTVRLRRRLGLPREYRRHTPRSRQERDGVCDSERRNLRGRRYRGPEYRRTRQRSHPLRHHRTTAPPTAYSFRLTVVSRYRRR
ncbi:hypothetical protein [Haloarcula sp. JP-L23]|uniref:hypothetical protein n=1 Tax=Haloarcula sp. JP-L23 TaxID=2716717 RepID=UPI00140ED647|nr:hypothetical protein G9465_18775 [Haloarcula sp. JP-L23]